MCSPSQLQNRSCNFINFTCQKTDVSQFLDASGPGSYSPFMEVAHAASAIGLLHIGEKFINFHTYSRRLGSGGTRHRTLDTCLPKYGDTSPIGNKQLVIRRVRRDNTNPTLDNDRLYLFIQNFKAACIPELRHHPNLLQILRYGWHDTHFPFLLLNYSHGYNLEEMLAHGAIFRQIQYSWCIQIVSALKALHKCGVVCLDLKPRKVLICYEEEFSVKLYDFTYSHVASGPSNILTFKDDPWSAPELRLSSFGKSHIQLCRCDSFSFGLIFWSMVRNTGPRTCLSPAIENIDAGCDRWAQLAIQECQEKGISNTATETLLKSTLAPEALHRPDMGDIMTTLQDFGGLKGFEVTSSDISEGPLVSSQGNEPGDSQPALGENQPLHSSMVYFLACFIAYEYMLTCVEFFQHLVPWAGQRYLLEELQEIVDRDSSLGGKVNLELSYCFGAGFGIAEDLRNMLTALDKAAKAGNLTAELVSPRIFSALRMRRDTPNTHFGDSFDRRHEKDFVKEFRLATSGVPNEKYLSVAIRVFSRSKKNLRLALAEQASSGNNRGDFSVTANVNHSDIEGQDLALLLACSEGNADAVRDILHQLQALRQSSKEETPLHFLIMFEDSEVKEIATLLASRGASLNTVANPSINPSLVPDFFGTPLHFAVLARNLTVVHILIEMKADLNIQACGYVPLEIATAHYMFEIAEALICAGARMYTDSGKPIIHRIGTGLLNHHPFLRWLIHGYDVDDAMAKTVAIFEKFGQSLHTADAEGATALMRVCEDPLAEPLIISNAFFPGEDLVNKQDQAAHRSALDKFGCSAVWYAIRSIFENNVQERIVLQKVEMLMHMSYSGSIELPEDGTTGLHLCAATDAVKVARCLIDHGSAITRANYSRNGEFGKSGFRSIYQPFSYKNNPIHVAAMWGSLNMIKFLLSFATNPASEMELCNGVGLSPLGCAIVNGHKEVADFLINNGAKIIWNDGSNTGTSALIAAVSQSPQASMVKHLLSEHSLKFRTKEILNFEFEGLTALNLSICAGSHEDAIALLGANADVNLITTMHANHSRKLEHTLPPISFDPILYPPMLIAFTDRHGYTWNTFDPTPCFPLRYAQNLLDMTEGENAFEHSSENPKLIFHRRERSAFRDRIFCIISALSYHGGVLCDLSGFDEETARLKAAKGQRIAQEATLLDDFDFSDLRVSTDFADASTFEKKLWLLQKGCGTGKTFSEISSKSLGCSHFTRPFKIQCPECDLWYTCSICHNEQETHWLESQDSVSMFCVVCKTFQPVGGKCVTCSLGSSFYCEIVSTVNIG